MDDKKWTQVKFRLTPDELEVWQKKADDLNMTLPKFSKEVVGQVITHGKIKQPKIDKDSGAEIIRHLSKLGGNVNQIAKWCNQNKQEVSSEQADRLAHNLECIQKELASLWQQLK